MYRILVVEDDRQQNAAVCSFLTQNGYETVPCLSAMEAYDAICDSPADLIISDIMMPDEDGFSLARQVRSLDREIPILFLTARDDLGAKKQGFDIGIDDFMVKPVNFDELLMRIGALLRRVGIARAKKLTVGDFCMDMEQHVCTLRGEEIALTVREFNILYKLLSNPKRAFTRSQLMDEFWEDQTVGTRAVDVYITKLRDKLRDCDDFSIVTVHGLGYKAVPKDAVS